MFCLFRYIEPGSHFPIEETVDNWISNDVHVCAVLCLKLLEKIIKLILLNRMSNV